MRLLKGTVLIIILVCSWGCSILGHMDQISMMGDYARDKNGQYKTVDQVDASYDSLVNAINAGKIKDYPDQISILRNFGDPILKKTMNADGQAQEQWLYRHAIPQKAKDKVYLYFDSNGKLVKYNQEKIQW
jgi:hypothetical protein